MPEFKPKAKTLAPTKRKVKVKNEFYLRVRELQNGRFHCWLIYSEGAAQQCIMHNSPPTLSKETAEGLVSWAESLGIRVEREREKNELIPIE